MNNQNTDHSGTGTESRIIAVDLDGTLVHTDILVESYFLFLRSHPLRVFQSLFWLLRGRAYFKKRIADFVQPEMATLPYNKDLLTWLEQRRQEGATLVLATASDQRIADKLAEFLGIFTTVLGTEIINLSSENKRAALVNMYGEKGYEYVGNSRKDLAVWKSASKIHVVNPGRGVLDAARGLGRVDMIMDEKRDYSGNMVKSLRVHQWIKNLLIFVPLLSSHRIMVLDLLVNGIIAFIAFCICASSVYLLNDLFDLQDDRRHSTKSGRPMAAGLIPIHHVVFLIPILLAGAFVTALFLLPVQFTWVLASYYILTLTYSLCLKRAVILDVITLSLLYIIRVLAGAAAMSLEVTPWILAFCLFIFLSLAFVKRYTELFEARNNSIRDQAAGRGYLTGDYELLAALGGASGYISVLVLALYINDAVTGTLYKSPQWMWAACPLLMYWLSRVWLLAHRGQMHEDPVVFALRDKTSRWTGVVFILFFVLATY